MTHDRTHPDHSDPARRSPTRRVRLTGPADLVQAVPYLLGFTGLHDDLVLVATREHRVVLTIRTALAALDTDVLWTHTSTPLANADATDVHLIAYPTGPVTDLTLRDLHTRLHTTCSRRPERFALAGTVTVADGRWWNHDLTGTPPTGPGHLIPESPAVTLGLAVATGVPAGNRDQALAVLRPHPEPVLADVRSTIARLAARTQTQRLAVMHVSLDSRQHRPRAWTVTEAADVLDALADLLVRDTALLQAAADHASWTWSTLLPYAPQRWIPAVATLVAVTAHQGGDGVLARAALDAALAADPGYSLAHLFAQVLALGLTPDTVRRNLLEPAAEEIARRGC